MIVDDYNHKIVTVYPYTDDALDKEFGDIKQSIDMINTMLNSYHNFIAKF